MPPSPRAPRSTRLASLVSASGLAISARFARLVRASGARFAPRLAGVASASVVLAASAGLGAPAGMASAAAPRGLSQASTRALSSSHELWATIDVCNPKDQPDTVGIRGSMPGDGRAADKMYMSFHLQYMSTSGRWVDLASGASPSYVAVGGSGAAREGGRSFQLVPVAGMPATTLRGVVDFQWRRGRTVLLRLSRASSAKHQALAGADPAGFSAASCLIG